jgi:hypothetical protein
MATFPRGHSNRTVHTGNQKMIVNLAPIVVPKVSKTARFTFTPGDNHTLRGIPAIGRGVAGHIPGTSPSGGISRLDRNAAERSRSD